MRVKMILPALQEAESPYWRPIKYSLFPPLGLATLAAYFSDDDDVEIQDQHIEKLILDDTPDLVCIQVYVTNAYRAYKIADSYRQRGVFVAMGGLHVTSLPDEASLHADTILLGPGRKHFLVLSRTCVMGIRKSGMLTDGEVWRTFLLSVATSSRGKSISYRTLLWYQEDVLIIVISAIKMLFMVRVNHFTHKR